MSCGCNAPKNKPSLRGTIPRANPPAPKAPVIPVQSTINLPSPAPVSNLAAQRRMKQLNQQAINKALGK